MEKNDTIFVGAKNAEKTMDWLPSPFQKGLADEFFEDGLGCMIETNRGGVHFIVPFVFGVPRIRIQKLHNLVLIE